MIKNKYVAAVVFVVLFLILWNALQYIQGKFTDGYNFNDNIVFPLVVSVVCAYITYLRPGVKNFDKDDTGEDTEKKE